MCDPGHFSHHRLTHCTVASSIGFKYFQTRTPLFSHVPCLCFSPPSTRLVDVPAAMLAEVRVQVKRHLMTDIWRMRLPWLPPQLPNDTCAHYASAKNVAHGGHFKNQCPCVLGCCIAGWCLCPHPQIKAVLFRLQDKDVFLKDAAL